MKKLLLLMAGFAFISQLSAQSKVTKNDLVGKWKICAVEMQGMMYYDVEKDSLSIGETMKAQIPDASQLPGITTMIKSQMGMFKNCEFVFNGDGTGTMPGGISGEKEDIKYTIDEAASTITTTDKSNKDETIKVEMVDKKIRFTVKQPQGEIILLMKK